MNDSEIVELFSPALTPTETIQFYFDEGLNQIILAPLRELEIVVITSEEESMKGTSDLHQLAKAKALGCVLVTQDRDFKLISDQINELWLTEGTTHAGIVHVEPGRSVERVVSELKRIHDEWTPAQMVNLYWTI